MLILFDHDGRPLTLHSATRNLWHRHEDCGTAAEVRRRRMGPGWLRPIPWVCIGVPWLLQWQGFLPDEPLGDPVLWLFVGFAMRASLQHAFWRRRLHDLPVVESGVVDFQNRLGRRIAVLLGGLAAFVALACCVRLVFPFEDGPWLPGLMIGLLVWEGARYLLELVSLLRLKARRSLAPTPA